MFTICPYKAVTVHVYKMLSRKFGFGEFRSGSRGGLSMLQILEKKMAFSCQYLMIIFKILNLFVQNFVIKYH